MNLNLVTEYLQSIHSQIKLKDLFDLLILWIIIYRVMILTEKSGITKILAGVISLAILYIVSFQLQLMSVHYILDNFFSNLFLILVILFQNEIRKVLIEIGSPMFSTVISLEEENRIVNEVSEALKILQKNNWGALIVVEKEMDIDSFIEQGVELNADVSKELIVSLFEPSSPLHDGALVIRGAKIESAGNFLPLSKNPVLDKNLGTRHRAALGLSELTDARIFIMSEEKRKIGLVESGTLQMVTDMTNIRKYVVDFLGFGVES